MTRRALITGAAGFAGRHLTNRMVANGWEVIGTDRGADGLIPCDFGIPGDIDNLLDAIGEVTHVFHLAARTFVPDSMADPSGAFSINLNGTVHLLSLLSKLPRHPRVLFISSAEAYGPPQSLPMDESHPLNPQNPYAISKAAADQFCAYLSRTSSLEIVRVRPFNHSGPGQTAQFVLSSFARQIAGIEAETIEPVIHVGNLDARRDFTHVDDVMAAYEMLALKGTAGEAYNVCSGDAVRIGDALERMCTLSPAKIEVQVDPARVRPIDVPEVRGSNAKLREHTGWNPTKDLDSLFLDLLAYWRNVEAASA